MARSYDRALVDLQALRVVLPSGHIVPAAGLPWFMAVFGRDSLISGIQTLAVDPSLAHGALRALAEYQANVDDHFVTPSPDKIRSRDSAWPTLTSRNGSAQPLFWHCGRHPAVSSLVGRDGPLDWRPGASS